MTKITYVGLERCDFVYHLATLLSLQGRVLVIDNSYGLDLIDTVSTDGTREKKEWKNITYVADVDAQKTDTTPYEYVIVYAGYAVEENNVIDDNFTLVMPDFTKTGLELMYNLPDMAKPIYILRDKATKKFTAKSLAAMMNIEAKDIEGAIPLNTQDISSYYSLTHNHQANVSSLSDDMIEALKYVIGEVFEISGDERRLNKIIKHAKKVK